ncbi:hypothetical protein RUND412_009379 [Rhizina undulata]
MTSTPPPPSLNWSTQLSIPNLLKPTNLTGDNILLPHSALEQLLSASAPVGSSQSIPHDPWAPQQTAPPEQQLPHPLIFRLYNPANNRFSYAVPREFSADEGEVVLSPFLREALGLLDDDSELRKESEGGEGQKVTVLSKALPKGTYVRLRPLEAGYDDEDWKALLERHLRLNFTTLTVGAILAVSGRTATGAAGKGEFRFLIDKLEPEEAVCILDTDLEVDIEPLSEEQARETLKQRIARQKKSGVSNGGVIKIDELAEGEVLPGEYNFYELSEWNRELMLVIELEGVEDTEEVDLFVSTSKQHHKPRQDEHVWGDLGSSYPKRIEIRPTNMELADSKAIYIGIHGYRSLDASSLSSSEEEEEDENGRTYTLRITQCEPQDAEKETASTSEAEDAAPGPDYKKCTNCTQWVPARTIVLHENFCLRNNIVCKHCSAVFKRGTESQHWHCSRCTVHGNNAPKALDKHTAVFHIRRTCPACTYEASNLPDLSIHRTTTCPGKTILCKFCHLLVPQEGEGDGSTPTADTLMTGLSQHELSCGSRTTDCHICSRIVKLRDLETHLKNHDLIRLSRSTPRICRNRNCARTLKDANNELGLCGICFGPLYAMTYDPTGAGLKRRVERKLLQQMLAGCGKGWCRNAMCRTGTVNRGGERKELVTTAVALPLIRPVTEKLLDWSTPLDLCVDEQTQRWRDVAKALQAESVTAVGDGVGGYDIGFCVAAVEEAKGDVEAARRWLEREGVRSGER